MVNSSLETLICGKTCFRFKHSNKGNNKYTCFVGSGQGADISLGKTCAWGYNSNMHLDRGLPIEADKDSRFCPYLRNLDQDNQCLILQRSEEYIIGSKLTTCDYEPRLPLKCPRYFHKIKKALGLISSPK
jgi:hypothetical protein